MPSDLSDENGRLITTVAKMPSLRSGRVDCDDLPPEALGEFVAHCVEFPSYSYSEGGYPLYGVLMLGGEAHRILLLVIS